MYGVIGSFRIDDARGKVAWGAAPNPLEAKPTMRNAQKSDFHSSACRPLLPTSSAHGDIKDASNGASGGGCARPRALVAVQPRLHHGRLAVRHLAQRQHGATLWLALEAARSCHQLHGCRDQVLVAADYVELGPRLKRSNLEYVILQGSHFHRTKWQRVLQRCSRQPGLVPRWTGWRLLLSPNDYFLNTVEVRLRRLEHSS